VGLAARGARNMDNGIEEIKDEAVLRQVRKQARIVNIRSALLAAVLTIAILLIP
jgi:hypothetical protein